MLSSDSLLTRYTFASPSLIYSLITFRMTVVSVNLPTNRPRGKPSLQWSTWTAAVVDCINTFHHLTVFRRRRRRVNLREVSSFFCLQSANTLLCILLLRLYAMQCDDDVWSAPIWRLLKCFLYHTLNSVFLYVTVGLYGK